MKITREKLRLWGACYDDAKIAALVPEAGLTPLEVAARHECGLEMVRGWREQHCEADARRNEA